MAKQVVNNLESGLLVRTKINENFDELYGAGLGSLTDVAAVDDMFGLVSSVATVDGTTAQISAFFVSFPQTEFAGGGVFVWQAGVDKATANGGTIVDPANIGGFDGTVLTRDAFLAAQGGGVGLGCWVRNGAESVVSLSMYGGVGDAATDNSVPWASAAASGLVVEIPKGDFHILTPQTFHKARGFGRESRITYNGVGSACLTPTAQNWSLDKVFIVIEESGSTGLDVTNQSFGTSYSLQINGRKSNGKTGQTGILITGDNTGGYWNRFISPEVVNVNIGYSLQEDANSNDFIGAVSRLTDIGAKLFSTVSAGFHCLNNHFIGGSFDTFDTAAFDITDADNTVVNSVYIESITGGSRPWIISAGSGNSFVNEFNNVALGSTDSGTNTQRTGGAIGARLSEVRAPLLYLGLADTDPQVLKGSGSPEGVVAAGKSSIFIDVAANGATNEPIMYIKGDSSTNTGWIAQLMVRTDAGGTPEGRVTMVKGTLFTDTVGTSKLYLKTTTGGNTGWVVVGTQT